MEPHPRIELPREECYSVEPVISHPTRVSRRFVIGAANSNAEDRPSAMSTKPQDSSDLYRRLVESVSDYAIFALDAKGYVSSWNPGAQRIKGYTADEIMGRHFPSTRRRTLLGGNRVGSWKSPLARDASKTRAGGCAKTVRASGPTL